MRPSIGIIKDYLWDVHKKKELYGAEIGVGKGENAANILANIPTVKKLILVDNYKEADYESLVRKKLKKFKGRTQWMIGDSVKVAKKFKNNTFDFIYIDGDHKYKSVMADLLAWYPKMKDKGVFCGHDFWYGDVSRAVLDFAETNPIPFYGVIVLNKTDVTIHSEIAAQFDWWNFT